MTEYYLKTDGNDGLDGLSWATAWETVAHAQVTISPYDMVHIWGGSYPETSTFIFNPPEGTEWMGEDPPLSTHLFNLGGYNNTFVVTNDNVRISNCKVGTFVSPYMQLDCTGFWFSSCEIAIWLQGAAINPRFEGCWIDTNQMCVIDFDTPSAATGIYWDLGGWQDNASGYCNISGTGHYFQYLVFGTGIGQIRIYCTDITLNYLQLETSMDLWGSSGNTVNNSKYFGAALLHIVKDASADGQQTIHNFEYPDLPILKTTVDAGASLTIIQDDRGFLETSNNLRTTITTSNSQLVVTGAASNVTFTKRPLLITTNANISVLVDTWSVAGDQNKAWKVEATGARTITFQLGDMLPDTKYDLKVGGVKVSDATSNGSGVVTFSPYSGSFSEKEFGAEKSPEVTFIPLIIIT